MSVSRDLPEVFQNCPACGVRLDERGANPLQCGSCDFVFYFNPAIAVVGFVADAEGRLLVVRRERDPGRGMLGFPGGFVDAGESAEQALSREIREETGLDAGRLSYLASCPNEYVYRGIRYEVTDIFFTARVDDFSKVVKEESEIQELLVMKPETIDPASLVFPSNRWGLSQYLGLPGSEVDG